MVAFDAGATLADRFRSHAGTQTHLYGHLMRAMADDLDTGGPVREICRGYEHARTGSVVQLRLLAGLFRIVLTGRAPQLDPFYPVRGGTAPPDRAWPVVRPVLAAHVAELHTALAVPPQTNEVGRSAALLAGLFDLVGSTGRRRLRLWELGASAGLNLLLPHFWFGGPDGEARWDWGPAASPVRLAGAVEGLSGAGLSVQPFRVVLARGCDPDPVDATTAAGRLLLTSYVWPFHVERHARLAGALQVAADHPPTVERGTAADWLTTTLAGLADDVDEAVLDVVWHSVSQLYWPPGESEAVHDALTAYAASTGRPVARVAMEYLVPGDRGRGPELRTTLWSGDTVRVADLGTVQDHGVPVRLRPSDQNAGSPATDDPGPA